MDSQAEPQTLELNRDSFMRLLIRELTGELQDVIGLDGASGYISLVGIAIGEKIERLYLDALGVDRLSRDQLVTVLLDLKKKIDGDFFLKENDQTHIALGNRRCPFGEMVKGRSSLCMMTSNVFGYLAAQSQGYARVDLIKTIATGAERCHVAVHFDSEPETATTSGQHYYRRTHA